MPLVSQLVAAMARLGTLLLLSLLLHQVTGSKHVLKRCSKRKPGKSTGGCSYTCNRRLGKWRAKKLCRTSIEVGKNLTEEEVTYEVSGLEAMYEDPDPRW